jgi:hypothetical protein
MRQCLALVFALAVVCPRAASAQTDEIQVYDGGLSPPGIFNLTWHNNFTPKGIATEPYPGGVVADESFNGVTEWAYGVTDWFEQGLYLPLYTHDKNLGWGYNGFKVRELFAVPHADMRTFFYGVNFEFSINQPRWDDHRYTSEVRPIVGWHFGQWDVIVNPIVDTAYDGWGNLEFVPAERVAYNFKSGWTLSAEEYADYGPLNGFYSAGEQAHQLYGVVNKTFGTIEIEAGAGFGLTDASDRCTLKLLVIHDLNKKPIRLSR